MKVIEIHRSDGDTYEERKWLEILINDKKVFSIGSGEPEDMSLDRDLNDAHKITSMMKEAYEAGKNGEPFELEKKDVTGWD